MTEVIDILSQAVAKCSGAVEVSFTDYKGLQREPSMPEIAYGFGSAEYFKDWLDEASKLRRPVKLPMVWLFAPVQEDRSDPSLYSKCSVSMLIVCSTQKEWSNEQRKAYSFENVLRPIYRALLGALGSDARLEFGYRKHIRLKYSENYSYGKYGAYVDRSGEMVSEPIDAIDIRDLELKIKNQTCR